MNYLVGIDIGTSACKVAIFREDGTVAASASGEYPVYYPRAGWAEQNPAEWWDAVCRAAGSAISESGINPHDIAAVGVDGQSWSAIPIDKEGKVLCPTPIWMDTRAEDICRGLDEHIGKEKIFAVCGNPLKPAYTSPKVLWYRKHRPEVYEKTAKILQSNGYIVLCLTGVVSQDKSQGYGWHCFDMAGSRWDTGLCREMGIDVSMLPELADCDSVVGYVTRAAAEQCGIPEGTPVVAGGLDAACGALGAGVISDGQTQEQGGQAGGMSICCGRPESDIRLILSSHVVREKWLLQGGTVGGGSVAKWFDREFGNGSFADLDRLAAKAPAGCDGTVFLPYMAGERSPVWDANAKGVYYGLDFRTTKAHFARAALEGVAYALRHNLETAESAGAGAGVLISMGGAANSALWTQIKADVTGHIIRTVSSDTATTLGAAILAGVGTGVYGSYEEAVAGTVKIKKEYHPAPSLAPVYGRNYTVYRELYDDLRNLMSKGLDKQ